MPTNIGSTLPLNSGPEVYKWEDIRNLADVLKPYNVNGYNTIGVAVWLYRNKLSYGFNMGSVDG